MAKKGQGALEYLMTYGWALLVIVIVFAALYAMGILNPSTYQQNRCTGFQHFTFNDQKLSSSQYILDIRNSGTSKVSVTSIKVGSGSTDASATVSDSDIQPGDRFTVTTSNVPAGLTAGSSYPSGLQTVLVYSVTTGIANQTDTATCTGTVQ